MIFTSRLQVANSIKLLEPTFPNRARRREKNSVEFPSKRFAAAGARNFNIRRGSSELAITTQAWGDKPSGQMVVVRSATYVIS